MEQYQSNVPVIWGLEGEDNGAKENFETVMPENVPKLLEANDLKV